MQYVRDSFYLEQMFCSFFFHRKTVRSLVSITSISLFLFLNRPIRKYRRKKIEIAHTQIVIDLIETNCLFAILNEKISFLEPKIWKINLLLMCLSSVNGFIEISKRYYTILPFAFEFSFSWIEMQIDECHDRNRFISPFRSFWIVHFCSFHFVSIHLKLIFVSILINMPQKICMYLFDIQWKWKYSYRRIRSTTFLQSSHRNQCIGCTSTRWVIVQCPGRRCHIIVSICSQC